MKRGEILVLAGLLIVIALGAIVYEARRVIVFLVIFATEPAGTGCDEGPATDRRSTNSRGDAVEAYIKACTGFGTIVDYSIVLQLHGDEKITKLAEYDDARYDYPKFRWINDDTLSIDFGKVSWFSPKTGKVGSIHITYVYSKGE
jgi:hypothetical protein